MGVDVASCVADIAFRLSERLPEVVSSIADLVRGEIEELRDDALTELLYAGAEGNVTTVLQALRCGITVQHAEAPTAAIEHARRLAQHGGPVNTLVRAYRLGQRRMSELVFAELQKIDMTEQLRFTVLKEITATLFSYIDWVSEQVVAAYQEEREQWLATHISIRFLPMTQPTESTRSRMLATPYGPYGILPSTRPLASASLPCAPAFSAHVSPFGRPCQP